MEKRNFVEWLKTFRSSINGYDYYTDFAKVHGDGWKSARRNLEETFLVLDTLYNIKDLEDGIKKNFRRVIAWA